jgi:SNF2 family DNA or RNA helicase
MSTEALKNSDVFIENWSLRITIDDLLPAGKYLRIKGHFEQGELVDRLIDPQNARVYLGLDSSKSPVTLPNPAILAKEMIARKSDLDEGKVIEVRDRLWRVDEFDQNLQTLRVSSITGLESRHEFYVPVEEARVAVHPPPDVSVVGNPGYQRLLIQALKLDLMHGSAVLMGLQRSRVIPMPYQLVPVLMALELPSARLLLADDVGLGKTVEAGLVVSELLGRRLADRALFIVPANLREQWQDILSRFFHIKAEIISRRHLRQLEKELLVGGDPWGHYPFLIASVDYVKQGYVLPRVLQQRWDIIIIDEAHNVAKPHQNVSDSDPVMQRWLAAKEIAKHTNHLLLLTATPHNGYRDSFASLLQMLDPDLVSGDVTTVSINREAAKRHICQRRRKDVKEWLVRTNAGINPFPERDHKEEYCPPPSSELRDVIDSVNALSNHILESVKNEGEVERRVAKWTILHFHKRALSSPYALACSLRNRIKKIDDEIKAQTEKSSLAVRGEDAGKNVMDFDLGENLTEEELDERTDRAVFGSLSSKEVEKELLSRALDMCGRIRGSRDTKLNHLFRTSLPEAVNRAGGRNVKIIIFTRYRDTLEYLQRELLDEISGSLKLRGMEVYTIHGEMNPPRRKEQFEAFKKSKKAILITTDCMAEGIDLQYSANQLIHYELPWNPNRLEQRNGRIDRFGQPEKIVFIRTLILPDTLENAILELLMKKANAIRDEYGFAPPFFGDDQAILDAIVDYKLEAKYGPQKSLFDFFETRMDRERQRAQKLELFDHLMDASIIQGMREDSFYGQGSVNLDDVVKRMADTEAALGGKDEVERFVRSAISNLGGKLEPSSEQDVLSMVLPAELAEKLDVEEELMVTFNPIRGASDSSVYMLDLGSGVVSGLVERVKALAYTSAGERYGRTAAVGCTLVERVSTVFQVRMRYVVGGINRSIIEEIDHIGVEAYGDGVLDESLVDKLVSAKHEPHGLNEREIVEALDESIQHRLLLGLIDERAKRNCNQIVEERRKLRERLEKDGLTKGLEGFDEVSCASQDIITMTLYVPRRGGL